MRRLIVMVIGVCVLLAGYTTVFAAGEVEHDWIFLDTVAGDEVYYDQANYAYHKDTGIMDVWAKQTIKKPTIFYPKGSKGIFSHFLVNVDTNKFARTEYNFIDENGKILRHGTVNANDWSNMDETMKKIVKRILEKENAAKVN